MTMEAGDSSPPGPLAIAGVDEVGRGPLAGPVVAAAVVLDALRPIEGLADSKLLGAKQRRVLAAQIRRNALAYALGMADPGEIDRLNILQASLLAMERAVARLAVVPDLIRVDGNRSPCFGGAARASIVETVIGGDRSVPCISAASILAKVCRDRMMRAWHYRYPRYGFDRHKGYATRAHFEALRRYGPCTIHRVSFAPVRQTSLDFGS